MALVCLSDRWIIAQVGGFFERRLSHDANIA